MRDYHSLCDTGGHLSVRPVLSVQGSYNFVHTPCAYVLLTSDVDLITVCR